MNYIALPQVSIVAANRGTALKIGNDRPLVASLDSSAQSDRRSNRVSPIALKNYTLKNSDDLEKIIVSSAGSKIFRLAQGKGTTLITDFSLKDKNRIGLTGGLTFEQLAIEPGTGVTANDTLIRVVNTGEILAILKGVKSGTIDDTTFVKLDDRDHIISTGISQLLGRAILPAATFATGPTSGQFLTLNSDGTVGTLNVHGQPVPFKGQPVQGFSAVLPGAKSGTYWVLVDNGYGAKANSADSLLRFYAIEPDFKAGKVYPVSVKTGDRLSGFTKDSLFQLNDQNKLLKGFQTVVADLNTYPGSEKLKPGGIPVDAAIKAGRLLTGADFDLESFRRSPDGTYWFGEEFGPFLLHTTAQGTLLEAPIPTKTPAPNSADQQFVRSPDNPAFSRLSEADRIKSANLGRSSGFEGLAINATGNKLYAMLEGALVTDSNQNRLLINEFDLKTKKYTGKIFSYRLNTPGRSIGDMTAINDHEFIVIERDNGQGDASDPAFTNPARSKKLYKINLSVLDRDGFVEKVLLADLLNIADPQKIGGRDTKKSIFTFPFVTIEDVLPIDAQTLLVINDNNYPNSMGRASGQIDNTEFIKIRLSKPLDLTVR